MRFYRQKSVLLGMMALVAPLPLPFNEVVTWPAVIAFSGAAALFLFRTHRGERDVLPYWAMNLLALLYIPFLLGDLTVLRTGRFLTPLVHLALFAMAVKLFALRHEKDKWHLFLGLFFLFVASMGTSVHPAAVVYLLVFAVLATLTLMRFAGLHTVSTLVTSSGEPRVPVRRFLTGTILLSLVGAIPLFFFLPRLRQPYVYVPAGGSGGAVQVSGFADTLDLGTIDRVRSLRTVVFRFAYETPPPPATEMRFKAATYDIYEDGGWRRGPANRYTVQRGLDGFFHVQELRPISWMKIWLRQGSRRLVLPVEASVVDLVRNGLIVDRAGETRLLVPRPGTVDYRVGMAAEPLVGGWPGTDPAEFAADSVTPRMANLAESVMGTGEVVEKARRLERHLRTGYQYSLDPVNGGPRPIDSFLFDTGQGHCEYFASAMVLLLRSQGIAARMATGYLGAEYNPLEEYHIVRQSNAHAWVEVFVPSGEEEGAGQWTVFDPTPASARPTSGRPGWVTLMAQAYDYLLFRWDRYVLTYGFGDQVDVFVGLRNAWLRFWESLRSRSDDPATETEVVVEDERPDDEKEVEEGDAESRLGPWQAVPLMVLVLAASLWFWFRRERFSASKAYRTLRLRVGSKKQGPVPAWIGPLALEKALAREHPEVRDEARLIVSYYVRESFAGRDLDDSELAEVKSALDRAKRKLRKAA